MSSFDFSCEFKALMLTVKLAYPRYYNPHHDTWEPVIEPIDDGREERPWEVAVEVVRNDISIAELRRAAKQGQLLHWCIFWSGGYFPVNIHRQRSFGSL